MTLRSLADLRPRLREPRFWVVQALVILIAATDFVGDDLWPQTHIVSLITVILFVVPVTYAALNFGFAGALVTAAWCILADAPIIVWHHEGSTRIEELLQLAAIDAVAVFVASRIDREEAARARAEAAQAALRLSEHKYRSLFESSPQPVLLLGPGQVVRDLNPAAERLFGLPRQAAIDHELHEAAPVLEQALAAGDSPFALDGQWFTPLPTVIDDEVQVQVEDITRQESLRAYAHAVLNAQEEERRRLAQEIHDDTIQAIVLLCRRMDSLAKAATPALPEVAAGLGEVRRDAEATIRGLRRLTRALRPPVLDDLGLVASIRQIVDDVRDRTGLDAHFQVTGEPQRLPPEVELSLFRVAQEALHNAEQHARATRVSVRLRIAADGVTLAVADDGVGMDDPRGRMRPTGDHLGLVGMRERAQLIGGQLRVRSAPGRGVQIRLHVPIREGVQVKTD